ncbi:MAG: zinc ABC transporter substrate-binding protein [Alphaproteobacteria bacterium]
MAGPSLRRTGALAAVILALFAGSSAGAEGAQTRVFACEPEWASLARTIGDADVEVFSATTESQDPHHIRARPGLIAQIRHAQLVFCSGAGLEVGWLPILMQRGAAAGVQPGTAGYLMAADHVEVIEKPVVVDRSHGDIHPEGNPHVHLDPRNIPRVARELAQRLAQIDPANADRYQARFAAFGQEWSRLLDAWEARAKPLRGLPVVVHHKSWSYLIRWLGLREVATLEPKPGVPPTASHLQGLLERLRGDPPAAVIRSQIDSPAPAQWLAEKTGVPHIEFPFTVARDAGPGALADLFAGILDRLEKVSTNP